MKNEKELSEHWNGKAATLVGKTIASARYMTQDEADAFGWSKRALFIKFTDGSYIIPTRDDEGNDGGSIQGHNGKNNLNMSFPTL
jgi:hypothetical protein